MRASMRRIFYMLIWVWIACWGGSQAVAVESEPLAQVVLLAQAPSQGSLADAETAVQAAAKLYREGQYQKALEQYALALEIVQVSQTRHQEADILSDMAVVYRRLGDAERSLTLQQEAAQMYEKLGDRRNQAKALRRIGVLYRHQGELFRAIQAYEDSLDLLQDDSDQEEIANILINLGIVYGDLGRLQAAREHFERALEIYRRQDNQIYVSYTLGNLGKLFLYLGDSEQALHYLERSLEIKQALNDDRGEANTLLNIGTAYKNLGDFQEALALYYKALDLYKDLNESEGQAAALGSIGSAYEELGDLNQAREFQLQSLSIKKSSGKPVQLAVSLTNLASLATKQGHFDEAAAYLQEGLVIAVEHHSILAQANIYGQLGLLHLSQGMIEASLNDFSHSLELYEEIGSQKGLLEVLDYIGQAYLQQEHFQEALPYYERAAHLAEALSDVNYLWQIQYRLGQIALHQRQAARALHYFQASVDTLEQMRSYLKVPELRRLFMRKDLNPYTRVIQLLLQQQQIEEALVYLERFKARTFLELVAYGEPQLQAVPDLVQEEKYLSARIRFLSEQLASAYKRGRSGEEVPAEMSDILNREISSQRGEELDLPNDIARELHRAKEEYEHLLLRIKLKHPEYYRLKTVDAAEIYQLVERAMALLDDDVTILEYFLDEQAMHIWIIERERLEYVSVPIPYETVLNKVLRFRNRIGHYESQQIYVPLQDLYTWLIRPVKPYLEDKAVVGVVPFQILHFVPFSALISSTPSPIPQVDSHVETAFAPHYLIEDYAMFALPSLSMLPVVRERASRNAAKHDQHLRRYFLGIGNATEDLPGAAEEIRTVIGNFPNSVGYTGSEATKQRLLDHAEQYDIIHLATHGVYDKQHPMFSYLKFSGESYLYAREIFGLQLWSDLVTLSGCETLLPQQVDVADLHLLVSGDELVGFIRAFMYAGTPSVLSSLWRVSDMATQYLMSAFYQELPNLGKAKSLQRACQEVIQSTIRIGRRHQKEIQLEHPFFWSSFVLIGDWK